VDPESDVFLMNLLDKQYTKTPFYGVRRMQQCLRRKGYIVNHKRIRRVMRKMGLETIYPKSHLSRRAPNHRIYPYLLRGMNINHPNQVWCTDITYIRMMRGFLYLVAIMDWFSRYVLSWKLSISLDGIFCVEALEDALKNYSCPEIFNSDQGVQFTSETFTRRLESEGIRISMDGRGRVFDNIFIERLWRTLKYEEVYLNDYETVPDARNGLGIYLNFYNNERPHQSLGYKTPAGLHFGFE
jgi:putative transposase